jgi:hypothetical protein
VGGVGGGDVTRVETVVEIIAARFFRTTFVSS